ncbi:amidohydrolase family protein [Corallococcus exiguus]|nr:amidohydrolase family protein [Corallococcus exiguus]NPD21917.1 amidohydrolase family protein [Corallococcus exiguus]NRD47299.1 amidohydrolase family protein [Corallococcus exiguus]
MGTHDSGKHQDVFEQSYTEGVTRALPPPPPRRRRGLNLRTLGDMVPQMAPVGAIALQGCVLTPERAIENGFVIIGEDRTLLSVQEKAPQGVRIHRTQGVILPGLIDLHGHPEYNVFAPWEPPQAYDNRYQWRTSDIYNKLIRDPQVLLRKTIPGIAARYAEVRALVGGVTAIQGASANYPDPGESLVRNVDLNIFGHSRARSQVDLPSADRPGSAETFKSIVNGIQAREVDAFYLHLAEGRPSDERSWREFDQLVELGGLTSSTVIIHGTALSREHFGRMREAGAKLVWSPQSNLRLYNETTRVKDALELGLPVAIGADWMPSGSTSLLAELRVARRALAQQGLEIAPQQLVRMVTSDAARIAGLDSKLGSLEAGRPADLIVLERRHADAWENVVQADPSWVDLVMIDGDLSYGRVDWLESLAGPGARERLEYVIAWGKEMLLDTSHSVYGTNTPAPTLSKLRADLIGQYPQLGPIFI